VPIVTLISSNPETYRVQLTEEERTPERIAEVEMRTFREIFGEDADPARMNELFDSLPREPIYGIVQGVIVEIPQPGK